jgi:hypothetical protein
MQGQYGNAEALFARVLALQEGELGTTDPALATTLDNYALLMDRTGRAEAAADLRERAALIRSMHGGE